MTTTASKLRSCPFDVDLAHDARPADGLHSRVAAYAYGYYRSKDEDPDAPEHDISDRIWRKQMLSSAASVVRLADDLMRDSMSRAREAGASWDDIGRDLGITKQAAQQWFGRRQ